MNLGTLSKQLTKLYNTLGNTWLIENFETEPFEFRVFVRKGDHDDLRDYEVEVYTDRLMPESFKYKESKVKGFDGAHISVIQNHFKKLADYVDRFGDFRKTLGVTFMDKEYKG